MVVEKKLYTVDEFDQFIAQPENKDRLFELIHGEIVEKVPTQEHGFICGRLIIRIGVFLEQHNSGRIGPEIRHRMPGDRRNDRVPDVSIYLDTTTPPLERGPVPRMPDMAVEVKSPDDSYTEMREKAAYYLANGTKLVWLVYPEKRLVEVYAPGKDSDILDVNDTLTGGVPEGIPSGHLLPGLTLAVKDIFPK